MMERGKSRTQSTDVYSDSDTANKWEGKAAKTLGVARIAFPISDTAFRTYYLMMFSLS